MSEFPVSGPIFATVRISTGALRITAEERDTVTVDVQAGGVGEASRSAAENTLVEMVGDKLTIETPQARGFIIRRTPPVNITVRVPTGSRLMLRSASADLTCNGTFGDADINSASGDLRIDHIAGHLQRHAASGDMQFSRVDGDLTVHAASGDIRGISVGGSFTSKSASGDITIEAVGGPVRVGTASGDVNLGNLAGGETRIHTASGDVVIGVAEGTPVWLDLNSSSGDTRSDLPVTGEAPAGTTATLNLYVRTASGDITVRRAVTAPAEPAVVAGRVDEDLQD